MKKIKIFIDGREGTTGLGIFRRIQTRGDFELITLPDEYRKDPEKRKVAINSADAVVLCLPDEAARQAVDMIENPNTVIFDASTAHRTDPGWVYGLPELSVEQYEKIKKSKRIAVPGCHASGFICLVAPLVKVSLISADTKLTCHSITGYSGGGKKMIAQYESENRPQFLDAPRQYGISQNHKHLPEMVKYTGLSCAPIFCPIVADFYSGMLVTVPLFAGDLNGTAEDIRRLYKEKYNGKMNIEYVDSMDENGFVNSSSLSGSDKMQVTVSGNSERILLMARYDNLGKGASGAAMQLLNIRL